MSKMDTEKPKEAACRIVEHATLELKMEDGRIPGFRNGAVMKDNILVVDSISDSLQIYNRLDGRRIFESVKMEFKPTDVCVISDTEIAVCLSYREIVIMSLDSTDVVKQVKTFKVGTIFDFYCHSVAKWSSDKLILSGRKYDDSMLFWGLVSVKDERFVSIHNICKMKFSWTDVAVKQNTVYISCWSYATTDGVYAYDVSNLNQNPKFLYRHEQLKTPGSIMTDKNFMYVCDQWSKTIHQVSDTGELIEIHKLSSRILELFYDDRHGDLYTTSCWDSNNLTLYKMEYPHQTETVCNMHIMVVGPLHVGKTTLVMRMLGKGAHRYIDRHCADGIDVNCYRICLSNGVWIIETKDSENTTKQSRNCSSKQKEDTSSALGQSKNLLTIWDFPGSYSFNPNHLTFLTIRTIYLLVFDLSDHNGFPDKVHEIVDAGLNSMCSSSKEAKSHLVILVGTNVDKLSKGKRGEICEKYFEEIRSYVNEKAKRFCLIDEDYHIDNTIADSNLEELKRKIVDIASKTPYWDEEIPDWWLPLEQEVMRLKANGVKVIHHSDLTKMDKRAEREQLESVTKYLISNGTILPGRSSEKLELDRNWINDAVDSLGLDRRKQTSDRRHTELSDFHQTGILTSEFIGDLWKKNHPELFDNREVIIQKLEHLKVIARPMEFSIEGEKQIEDYYLAPSLLRQESPSQIITPNQDPLIVSTPFLCFVFPQDFSECLLPIFDKLSAACVARWPPGKTNKSENLIFQGGCICSIDLFHRLILHCDKHVVYARIIIKEDDKAKTLATKTCSRVKRFITSNLSQIVQDVKYDLHSQPLFKDGSGASFRVWCEDEEWDSESFMTREYMNYARLCVVIVTACANALRKVILTNVLYKSLIHNKGKLTKHLKEQQIRLVYPDRKGNDPVRLSTFDIPLLYILIRNSEKVDSPKTDWGEMPPSDETNWDNSLGASVERIHFYRNKFVAHPTDGKMIQKDFDKYWKIIERTLRDIKETVDKAKPSGDMPKKANDKTEQISDEREKEIDKFMEQFQKQSMQVQTVYDDC